MQVEPLDMILYVISMLPLTLQLKVDVTTSFQPLYADNTAAGRTFEEIEKICSYC